MADTYTYRYAVDNFGNICVDNNDNQIYIDYTISVTTTGVEVRRIRGKLFPCVQCRFYNSLRFPKTEVHAVAQLDQSYHRNINAGCNQPFITIIGECLDFIQKS